MFNKLLTGFAILLTILAFGAYWYFAGRLGISNNGSDWADFGSYAGGIFAALAFLVVIYQNYQRDKEQQKQDFEKTFSMMLEHHNAKLKNLESLRLQKSGERLIDKYYNLILSKESFSKLRDNLSNNDGIYSEIDSYSLTLYRLLKFIYKNMDLNKDKEYSGFLRSFLSRKILVILAFNIRNKEKQYERYIECINKLSFFEHLNLDELEYRFISFASGLDYKEALPLIKRYKDNIEEMYFDGVYENEDGEMEHVPSTRSYLKKDILDRGIEFDEDEDGYVYVSENSKEKFKNNCEEWISIDTILTILLKKNRNTPLEDSDFEINNEFRDFGEFENEYGDIVYRKFHRVEKMEANNDTLFIHILTTFSSEAFSENQKEKFDNLKKLYSIFIKRN